MTKAKIEELYRSREEILADLNEATCIFRQRCAKWAANKNDVAARDALRAAQKEVDRCHRELLVLQNEIEAERVQVFFQIQRRARLKQEASQNV